MCCVQSQVGVEFPGITARGRGTRRLGHSTTTGTTQAGGSLYQIFTSEIAGFKSGQHVCDITFVIKRILLIIDKFTW